MTSRSDMLTSRRISDILHFQPSTSTCNSVIESYNHMWSDIALPPYNQSMLVITRLTCLSFNQSMLKNEHIILSLKHMTLYVAHLCPYVRYLSLYNIPVIKCQTPDTVCYTPATTYQIPDTVFHTPDTVCHTPEILC